MTTPHPHTAKRTARLRTFGSDVHGDTSIAHDAPTGLTHKAPCRLDLGRIQLDPAEVATWPTILPCDSHGPMPISVCWSPIVRCNLTCAYCLDDKSVSELAHDDRRRIADLIAGTTVLGVDISGGEPLLLRDLPELVDILATGDCVVSVTTNGTHLVRRAEALANRVDAIRVSLDGASALEHDRWRGPGSFDKAISGIRAAVAYGIPTQIQRVLLRSSSPVGLQLTVDLAASLGAHGVTFLQMLPVGEGAALADSEQLSDDEALELLSMLDTNGLAVRLRTRESAGGFTVIRADGQIWRNDPAATAIAALRPLRTRADLRLTGRDGSA